MQKSIFKRFLLTDIKGLAALEFALILPLLVLIYVGTFYSYEVTRSARQVSKSANTVSDLSSRIVEMNADRFDAFSLTAEALIPNINQYESFELSITSVVNPAGGAPLSALDRPDVSDYEVDWSKASNNANTLSAADLINFELPEIPDGESIILTVIEAEFKPTFFVGDLSPSKYVLRSAVRRPRFTVQVPHVDDN